MPPPKNNSGLSGRVFYALWRTGYVDREGRVEITEVVRLLKKKNGGVYLMMTVRNFGEKSLDEVYKWLDSQGVHVERSESSETDIFSGQLMVPVGIDFVLDAGAVQEDGNRLVILPPQKTMFSQLIGWLKTHPIPHHGHHYSRESDRALSNGITALCFRWGTYLAVLMDEYRPKHPDYTGNNGIDLINDSEVERIDIEASSNLAQLMKMLYKNRKGTIDLILRASYWLPMPNLPAYPSVQNAYTLHAHLQVCLDLVSRGYVSSDKVLPSEQVMLYPHRALANMITLLVCRNGIVENVRVGSLSPIKLNPGYRRLNLQQARIITRYIGGNMHAMVKQGLVVKKEMFGREWPDYLVGLQVFQSYPEHWTMTESSSRVEL